MATVSWTGNAAAVAMVQTLTVTAVATNGVLSVSLNGKTISYTVLSTDTPSTAATGLQALLAATGVPAEFTEIAFTVSGAVITATANALGTPFAGVTGPGLTVSGTGGATITQATTTANVSPSDVNNAQNWLRNGVAALPQNQDDMVIANSTVPLLWNLDQLSAVQLNSLTRHQSFTGQIGLPYQNPLGYVEWRARYLKLTGASGTLPLLLGQGQTGGGPALEQYDCQQQKTSLIAIAAGSATGDYNVYFLGSNAGNTVQARGASVAVAFFPGETASINTAIVDTNGSLSLGSGVTFGGSCTFLNGTGVVACPCSLFINTGSQVTVTAQSTVSASSSSSSSPGGSGLPSVTISPLTFPVVTLRDGSQVAWISDANITTLTMTNGSFFDKSLDTRTMTVSSSTIDANCTINDPNNCITYSTPTTVNGAIVTGPWVTGPGRKVQVI